MEFLILFVMGFVMLAVWAAVNAAIMAWPVMVLIGVIHSIEPSIPAIGYVLTFLLVFTARLAVTASVSND